MSGRDQSQAKAKASKGPAPGQDLPPCLIFIDKEGRMFHQGTEMIHAGINSLLLENLTLDNEGRYIIDYKDQKCWVEVEDTPVVVQGVESEPDRPGRFKLALSDQTKEELNPELLWISPENVLYTKIRAGRLPARFLRPAYYQLAEFIEETDTGFALDCGGRLHPISQGRP
ncbi:MAG: DUF1285 domain-containing protein [Deltaproteobacteria bacterium]|nr:DUF1285 domain-containing protein [Deltaproteobacteria bacterium]